MAYDSRRLLHYFRLMPDGRFLFGMRGGTHHAPKAVARMKAAICADFEAMFPAWAHVETPYFWSGLACLSRNLTNYVGPLGSMENAYVGMAYHGSGIAMASYTGKLLSKLAVGEEASIPAVMRSPLRRFPFASLRRGFLHLAYKYFAYLDR